MGEEDLRNTLPIPTYEEAIASRPSSSNSHLGPTEVSHDAERQGLLWQGGGQDGASTSRGYRQPTVESARSSMDFLGEDGESDLDEEGLRLDMSELEVDDPLSRQRQPSPMGALFSKRISSLTSGLSSSVRAYLPRVPRMRDWRWPEALRPSWIMVVRAFALILVLSLGWLFFFSDLLHLRSRGGYSFDLGDIRRHIFMHLNESDIRENLRQVTRYDHVAGTEGAYYVSRWIESRMHAADLEDVNMERFDVYLNYPRHGGRSVQIVEPKELAWTAELEEPPAYSDPPRPQTPTFHGYSKSGDVTGPLVYANYGSREDFDKLAAMGVNVTGSIVLVRYYGTQTDRGLKVKAAEMAGAVGCLIYSDPQQDGFVNGPEYPEGAWRPKDSVQRGTVAMTSWITGDPLSPGFASLPEEPNRISKENNPALVNIPSLPLAWRDAQPLLAALKGAGQKIDAHDWIGGVPIVEWWTGTAESSPIVRLQNEQDEVDRQPIRNVLGRIVGLEQPEKVVTVGSHYDAWCFGGSDPGSGTAVLMEMVRIFGDLKSVGWRPRRTLEFAAWDAEEYNLVGSTEHVEARIDAQRADGFAYINVDVAVGGPDFRVAGSPLMSRALLRSMNYVGHPSADDKTMRRVWTETESKIGALGAGSDYVAFQDLAGTSSIDLSFSGAAHVYHSCSDGFEYVDSQLDPGFRYHRAMAEVWAMLILELADEPLVPLDMPAYAEALGGFINDLESTADSRGKGSNNALNVTGLRAAQQRLTEAAERQRRYEEAWYQAIEATGGFESTGMTLDRLKHNAALAQFETDLLDLEVGLPTRPQYKHVIFAPEAWSSYDGATLPGPRDALETDDWAGAQKAADRAAAVIDSAVDKFPL